jgi:hypothetical protein
MRTQGQDFAADVIVKKLVAATAACSLGPTRFAKLPASMLKANCVVVAAVGPLTVPIWCRLLFVCSCEALELGRFDIVTGYLRPWKLEVVHR